MNIRLFKHTSRTHFKPVPLENHFSKIKIYDHDHTYFLEKGPLSMQLFSPSLLLPRPSRVSRAPIKAFQPSCCARYRDNRMQRQYTYSVAASLVCTRVTWSHVLRSITGLLYSPPPIIHFENSFFGDWEKSGPAMHRCPAHPPFALVLSVAATSASSLRGRVVILEHSVERKCVHVLNEREMWGNELFYSFFETCTITSDWFLAGIWDNRAPILLGTPIKTDS